MMSNTDYAKLAVRICELDSKMINKDISEHELVEEAHAIGNEVTRIFG